MARLPQDAVRNSPSDRTQVDIGRSLVHGERVCISVEATDWVGITSTRAMSNCATCDATPPFKGFIGVGAKLDHHQVRGCSKK